MKAELKTTPLFNEHKVLEAKLAPFSGWFLPIQYTGIIAEHNWTRRSCSLFDISYMGKFVIRSEPGKSNLEKIVTINLAKMPLGSCRYGFMLAEDGGIIDDIVVYKLKKDKWMLVGNAANAESDAAYLKRHLSKNCQFEDVSNKLGKLDLQGPFSRNVLKRIVGEDISRLKYYRFDYFSVLDEEIIISRTGYTGELGYELYLSNKNIEELWHLLLKDDRVKPAGLGARDTLRLEMGLPLYGQDINRQVSPKEAGLERFVDFSKDFLGREAIAKKNIKKRLSCFAANSRRAPRQGYKIYSQEKEIGVVTSGSFSPSLSCGIGMGYIDLENNKIGANIVLKQDDVQIEATIVNKPFYKQGSVNSHKSQVTSHKLQVT
ncbi:MAG: glycine cleavage system aminomethyltransferase GcvT [Candidatus Omnitrophica bacterium]|nr:glycine cleavage system aminomethyltransferase GcvT [Candidatus Omnitrophota bacterium]